MVALTASLTELVAALEARDVSARELLDTSLDRVERLDGPINSVVTIAADRAHAEADQIDDARSNGLAVGPLAGVPITIKDALATEGIVLQAGQPRLRDFVPEVDATVVSEVREAGAVVFGKTNIPRWSGDYQSYNDIFGTTSNPWDLERTRAARREVPLPLSPWASPASRSAQISADRSVCLHRSAGIRPQTQLRRDPELRLPRQRSVSPKRCRCERLRSNCTID